MQKNQDNVRISKHLNDIIQKYANGLFRNVTLEFYGINTAGIKELVNPEVPVVAVSGSGTDIVFLLVDDTYLHFAFETGYDIGKLIQSAGYDLRLYARDKRKVHSVIIYTADVKKMPEELVMGSLSYKPDVILMCNYDGNAMFAELESKIKEGQELTDIDMLNLVLVPLMKHNMPRQELAKKSMALAQTIPDAAKREACIAAAYAFAARYLSSEESKNLLEVIKMVDWGKLLVEDTETNVRIELAKKLLKRGISVDAVVEDFGLEESMVIKLRDELKREPAYA